MSDNRIEIRSVLLFGGNAVDKPQEYIKRVKNSVLKYFDQAEGLKKKFKVAEDLQVDFFYVQGVEPVGYKISSDEEGQEENDWYTQLKQRFGNQEGYLVLCDYRWPGELHEVREAIYDCFKNQDKVVFVCHSTVFTEKAQNWVDQITKEDHTCTIVDVVLSMPKDMQLKVRVLAEAIQDVW